MFCCLAAPGHHLHNFFLGLSTRSMVFTWCNGCGMCRISITDLALKLHVHICCYICNRAMELTHPLSPWWRIYASVNRVSIGSDYGLSPIRCHRKHLMVTTNWLQPCSSPCLHKPEASFFPSLVILISLPVFVTVQITKGIWRMTSMLRGWDFFRGHSHIYVTKLWHPTRNCVFAHTIFNVVMTKHIHSEM